MEVTPQKLNVSQNNLSETIQHLIINMIEIIAFDIQIEQA